MLLRNLLLIDDIPCHVDDAVIIGIDSTSRAHGRAIGPLVEALLLLDLGDLDHGSVVAELLERMQRLLGMHLVDGLAAEDGVVDPEGEQRRKRCLLYTSRCV